jgi:hypothetical protein
MAKATKLTVACKYLQYPCEASDFGHKRDDMVQNFVKTKSFRPRKTLWNTVNFCQIFRHFTEFNKKLRDFMKVYES